MNKQKSLVYTLILLLTISGTLSLFSPAQADTWTDITLPYTITQAGSYRISAVFIGAGTALSINASNVVVDGQNNLLTLDQSEGNTAIYIAQNSRNVFLKNINETGADYGVYAKEGNFTVTDSLFTNNNSTAIFAFNATAFTFQHSRASNNTYGLVAIDCSNFTVNDCHIKSNTQGVVAVLSSGVTIQSSYFNNNAEAISAQNCTDLHLDNSVFVENEGAVNATFTTLEANSISASSNVGYGIRLTYSNLTAYNSECQNNSIGLYSIYSNFAVTYSSVSNNNIAGILSGYGNTTLNDCALENNTMYGILSMMSNKTQIESCSVKNNEYGIAALDTQEFQLTNSLIFNNSFAGVVDELSNKTRITSNNFTQNGLDIDNEGYGGGALLQIGTNCIVSDNVFRNNYDGLLIGSFGLTEPTTQIYRYNTFENNTYTFDLNYNDALGSTNDTVYFYNNYVNDIAYVNPISFTSEGQVAPAANVLYLNTTLQAGKRVTLDGGRMIGGNYWAHPNGTGPSQTGADKNHDGFLDTPFDLFGNQTVIDYLPYSSSFKENVTKLTISPSAATVKAGQPINYTVTAYDQYGNAWNVTADLTANGTPFSGNLSIAEPNVYTITASYGGQTVDASLNVVPGEIDHYVVITPTIITAGSQFTVRIVAVDGHANVVTDYSGTVALSASNGTITPSTSGAFSYGTWIGNLTVTGANSFNITATDGNGKSGISSTVTATQEQTEPTTTPTPTPTPTSTIQPTVNPTNSTAVGDNYWWAWYILAASVFVVLAGAGVYFIKHSAKTPQTQ